jgi:hypothetical protein
MFLIPPVATATIISPLRITHARGVIAPRMSNRPKTNSTVETKRALNSGKGTCAATKVSRICSCRSVARSFPRPEDKTANRQPPAPQKSRGIGRHATRSEMSESTACSLFDDSDESVYSLYQSHRGGIMVLCHVPKVSQ